MTSVYITLFMFIHNSSSENGQKTTASAPTVSENFSCNFDFHSWISSDGFDTNPVNSFLTSVLPVILKEIKSNFLISTLRLFKKLSHKKPSS